MNWIIENVYLFLKKKKMLYLEQENIIFHTSINLTTTLLLAEDGEAFTPTNNSMRAS